MIKHAILVVEEKPPAVTVWPPMQHLPPVYPRGVPQINSQEDLDKWNNETVFQVGDYVTFMHNSVNQMQVAYNVYVISEKATDYDKMQRTKYGPYLPLVVLLKSMPNLNGHGQTMRWDDLRSLRKITQTEWEKTVKDYLDRVRDHSKSPA